MTNTNVQTKTKVGIAVGVVILALGLSYALAVGSNKREYSKMVVTCQDGSNEVYINGSVVAYDASGNSTKSSAGFTCAKANDWYERATTFCKDTVNKETEEKGIAQYRVDVECAPPEQS